MAAGTNEADMVLELLQALRRHRPTKPPARLSPAVELAYQLAEEYRDASRRVAERRAYPEVA